MRTKDSPFHFSSPVAASIACTEPPCLAVQCRLSVEDAIDYRNRLSRVIDEEGILTKDKQHHDRLEVLELFMDQSLPGANLLQMWIAKILYLNQL